MSDFKLRAHHGLCIAFFEGKGYDDDFISNMSIVVDALSQNPDVTIVSSEDIVCTACPNNIDGICNSTDGAKIYDKRVLRLCDIRSGTVLPWKEFETLVSENIIKSGKMSTVCADCKWSSICFKRIRNN